MAWCPTALPSVPHNEGRSLKVHSRFRPCPRACDGSPMTVRGGGVPRVRMALMPTERMGPPPRSFAADAHHCIMVRVSKRPSEYKHVARSARQASGLPSISSSRPQRACCRARGCQGVAWQRWSLVNGRERRPTLTAPARDSVWDVWVGAKKRASGSNKETDEEKRNHPLWRGLTTKPPYKRTRDHSTGRFGPAMKPASGLIPLEDRGVSPACGARPLARRPDCPGEQRQLLGAAAHPGACDRHQVDLHRIESDTLGCRSE